MGFHTGEDAGLEAGVPTEAGWKKAVKGGGKTVNQGRNPKSGLCSITRIYTHLHDFTQGFWAVTLRRRTKRNSPQRRRDAEGGNGDWPQKIAENAKDRKFRRREVGVGGGKLEKAVVRWLIDPPFRGKSRLGRRKWLISRL